MRIPIRERGNKGLPPPGARGTDGGGKKDGWVRGHFAFPLTHTRRREKRRRVFLFTSLLRHTLAKKPLLSPAVAALSKVQGTDSVAASASVAAAKEGGTDRPTPLKALFLNFFLLLPPPFLLSKSKSRSLLLPPPPPLPPFRSLVARKRERRGERERETERGKKKRDEFKKRSGGEGDHSPGEYRPADRSRK